MMAWLVTSLEHPSGISSPGRQLSASTASSDTAQKDILSEFLSTLACQFWSPAPEIVSPSDMTCALGAGPPLKPRRDRSVYFGKKGRSAICTDSDAQALELGLTRI